MQIKILGAGCPKCKALEKATRDVVTKLGLEAEIIKVTDMMDIMNYGVAQTPALVIDEKVVVKGRVPSETEIEKLIRN
jgi:small redox-active disulfide protein 2